MTDRAKLNWKTTATTKGYRATVVEDPTCAALPFELKVLGPTCYGYFANFESLDEALFEAETFIFNALRGEE